MVQLLPEIWMHRELLYFLVWRDVKVRYKQTALGIGWAVLQPVMTMLVFALFFGYLGHLPAEGFPYPVFVLCGILPWQLFAYALTNSANSLVDDAGLITKVYFPRIVVPLAALLSGVIDFGIACLVLFVIMMGYGVAPGPAILLFPVFLCLAWTAAAAAGIGLAALNVSFRDVRYTLPFLTQLWMLATPIAYPSRLVPPAWRPLYGLNPLVGVVDGFRWTLLGTDPPQSVILFISATVIAIGLCVALLYFRSVERTIADVV